MTVLLVMLIGGFAIAAAVALIRGLAAFFRDAEQTRLGGEAQAKDLGVKQNRMMFQRVLFQGIAILLVVMVGALAGQD